jgi:hypothetical protein
MISTGLTLLDVTVNWLALLEVTIVTIVGAVAIVGLMSLANWLLTPDGDGTAILSRRVAGYAIVGVMGLIVLGGLYLLIPYFR